MFKLLKNSCSSEEKSGLFGWTINSLLNNTVVVASPYIENSIWNYNQEFQIQGYIGGKCGNGFGQTISTYGNTLLATSKNCNFISFYESSWVQFSLDFEQIEQCGAYIVVRSKNVLSLYKLNQQTPQLVQSITGEFNSFACDSERVYTFGNSITMYKINDQSIQYQKTKPGLQFNDGKVNNEFLIAYTSNKVVIIDKLSLDIKDNIDIAIDNLITTPNSQFIAISNYEQSLITILSRNLPQQVFNEESKFLKPKADIPYYTLEKLYGPPNSAFGKGMAFTETRFIASYPLQNCFNVYSISSSCTF